MKKKEQIMIGLFVGTFLIATLIGAINGFPGGKNTNPYNETCPECGSINVEQLYAYLGETEDKIEVTEYTYKCKECGAKFDRTKPKEKV
jgi:rRNA maturation protein Nop10